MNGPVDFDHVDRRQTQGVPTLTNPTPSSTAPAVSELLGDALDAVADVLYRYDQFVDATTELNRATRLVDLNNAVDDLRSWHPGFDADTDTMPWDRNED